MENLMESGVLIRLDRPLLLLHLPKTHELSLVFALVR